MRSPGKILCLFPFASKEVEAFADFGFPVVTANTAFEADEFVVPDIFQAAKTFDERVLFLTG